MDETRCLSYYHISDVWCYMMLHDATCIFVYVCHCLGLNTFRPTRTLLHTHIHIIIIINIIIITIIIITITIITITITITIITIIIIIVNMFKLCSFDLALRQCWAIFSNDRHLPASFPAFSPSISKYNFKPLASVEPAADPTLASSGSTGLTVTIPFPSFCLWWM